MNYLKAFFLDPCVSIDGRGIKASVSPFVLLLGFLVFIGSMIWVARDAGKRGKSGFWACLFALMAGWPLSLLWWMWLRPAPRAKGSV